MNLMPPAPDDTEDPQHTPAERAGAASRSTWVNLLLTTVQIVAGLLTKSQGLVADGVHSL